MSAGCATRRSGVFTMLRCSPSSPRNADTRGVHTTPGATAFTRMPDGPSSTAPVRTSDMSPAFAAPYAEWRGADVMPDTDATNTIAPPWLAHRAPAVLHGEERVAQHDVEVPVPVVVGHVDEVGVARHADDVDDAVDPAERAAGVVEHALHVGAVERVAAERPCRRPRRRCRRRGRGPGRRTRAGRRPTRARATPGGRCPGRRRARRSADRRAAAVRDSRGRASRRCGSRGRTYLVAQQSGSGTTPLTGTFDGWIRSTRWNASPPCSSGSGPVATRRRRSAKRPTPSATVPVDELRELAAQGRLERPARHRVEHRPGDRPGARRARCPSTSPASRPRPRPTPVPAPRSAPRSRATSTSHSDWSDGGATIEADGPQGRRARPRLPRAHRPLAALTSPTASTPSGCESQLERGRELNEELAPFRILTGIEVDILDDGALDQDDDLLAELDVVVASVHSKLRMSEQPMTDRMVAAMANPHVDILGHCTGRMVLGKGRPESTFDADLVFGACAHFDKAVEINCRPERLDPPMRLLEQVVGGGVQGVDRQRRARRRPARVAALRVRPGGRGGRPARRHREHLARRPAAGVDGVARVTSTSSIRAPEPESAPAGRPVSLTSCP